MGRRLGQAGLMAVQDLWYRADKKTPTSRHGRGLRYRVSVPGHPTRAFATKEAARRHEGRLLSEAPRPESDSRTVRELLIPWLASKAGLSRSGIKDCRLAAAVVRERWGDALPGDIQAHEVQAWLVGVGGPEWRRKVLRALRGACLIGGVMLPKVDPGRVQRHEARFLTIEQLSALASASGRYGPMVWLLGTTGVRIGECVRLDVADVDPVRRRLRVRRSKNGRGRDVPIPAEVLSMLDLDHDGPLFVGRAAGHRISSDAWRQKVFHPAAKKAEMPDDLRPHDLRHTAASLAIASGATVKDVQSMLGHKSAAMTLDIYAGWWDTGLDEVADRMNSLVRTQTVPPSSD